MDKNSRSTLGKKDLGNGGNGGQMMVPFQGIGTRLRRSRSKDQSTDNLSSNNLEIANLKRLQLQQQQQFILSNHQNNGYNDGGLTNLYSSSGTLERLKYYYGNAQQPTSTAFDHHNSSFINSSIPHQQQFDQRLAMKNGNSGGSSLALYDESRLLSQQHQYEEPQYLIDANYRTRQQKDLYGKFNNCPSKLNDLNHRNLTIIPPSKLFAKTLSTSSSCKFVSSLLLILI